MIRYGWTWSGVYSYQVSMAPWVMAVLIAVVILATSVFVFTARRH
jgi:hypothetical protein